MNHHLRIRLGMTCVAWLGMVASGFTTLQSFELTPGPLAASACRWPHASRILLDAKRPTLVVFLHPRCPCTRATLDELAEIVRATRGRLSIHVLFIRPARFPDDWARTGQWARARAMDGVRVHVDVGGVEAARLGAETSGEVFLYGPGEDLLFRGGITWSRGAAGESVGRNLIISFATLGTAESHNTPVYGCALFGKGSDRGI